MMDAVVVLAQVQPGATPWWADSLKVAFGAVIAAAFTVLVKRADLRREHRAELYLRLLPELVAALPPPPPDFGYFIAAGESPPPWAGPGDTRRPPADVLVEIERVASVAGRRERRDAAAMALQLRTDLVGLWGTPGYAPTYEAMQADAERVVQRFAGRLETRLGSWGPSLRRRL